MLSYKGICEQLFAEWKNQRVSATEASKRIFTLQHAPEPYLTFGDAEQAAVFISTNPGVGFDFQEHPSKSATSIFAGIDQYSVAARAAAKFYSAPNSPINSASKANIRAMRRIAAALGFRSVMQIEAIPWHSASLSSKRSNIDALRRNEPRISDYFSAVTEFVREQPVVLAWSAGIPSSRSGEGLELKAGFLGLDLHRCEITPLERTNDVSQALLWQRLGRSFRGLFVNRGSATLPKQLSRPGIDKDEVIRGIVCGRGS